MNVNYNHYKDAHNPDSAKQVLPAVFDLIRPESVIDIGCARGSWLKVFNELGVTDILGVDGLELLENEYVISKEKIKICDLSNPLDIGRRFDMVVSLEVAEHLPEYAADTFVSNLVKHSDIILFSAAIPGQGGQFHLNEQWPEYWNKKFIKHGYVAFDFIRGKIWDDDRILWWYRQNMLFFVKKGNVKFKDFEPLKSVPSFIHPGLYRKKQFRPKFMANKRIIYNSIISHLIQLIKK